ncbi:MAG: YtoQ family protein [Planctomycetota bacterium]
MEPWTVYLAGEIHSDWRREIMNAALDLPVRFTAPVTDHEASDEIGVHALGPESQAFWKDRKGAGINNARTGTHVARADLVIALFGEHYRQWNTAFDAGRAAALGKPLITIHPEAHDHALKEIDAAAAAVCREPAQAVEILRYITTKN